MLDDLKYLHDHDKADALGDVEKQYQQLLQPFEEVFQDQIDVDNIVYAGMGGSALAALLSQTWPGYDKPFEVVRGYDIPAYVGPRTYFIAASYSGNTEETLSALEQAEAKGAQIAVIAGGGKLADVARDKNYPFALLPKATQPRYAALYNLKALVVLLDQAGLLASSNAMAELEKAAGFLKTAVEPWVPTVPANKNQAKQIALDVIGKSAVIYAGAKLWPAAYKWKIGFNENAKHVAWWNQYPEFNHNEFMGWAEQPVDKPYAVIDLRSNLEHPRVQQRFSVSERLLSGRRPTPIVVDVKGESLLEQLLWAVALGDFVTIYTALANGVNPGTSDFVEKFKQELDK
ncbi:MAG TPA: bifunctional phosphoglucose/phosphomannose isomerase [Candidatus Saccharimonadales bacterium]